MKDISRHEVVQCSLEKTEIRKSFMKKCRQFGWLAMPIIPVAERRKQKNGQVQNSQACQERANLKTKPGKQKKRTGFFVSVASLLCLPKSLAFTSQSTRLQLIFHPPAKFTMTKIEPLYISHEDVCAEIYVM